MTDDKDELIRQLTIRLRETVDENDKLRAVVAKLTEGTDDAHSTLRRLYLDETLAPTARVRAAAAALNVEKPSLKPEPAPLELVAQKIEPLADLVTRQRRRANALQGEPLDSPKFLEWAERDDGTYPADDDTPGG
jgi:hypothetical protein